MQTISQLDSAEKELLGHLYFSEPAELDLEKVVEFISTQLQLSYPWDNAFESLIACHMQGLSPVKWTYQLTLPSPKTTLPQP